jgi:hypothetical protein
MRQVRDFHFAVQPLLVPVSHGHLHVQEMSNLMRNAARLILGFISVAQTKLDASDSICDS